jgi:hypothetical protein
MRLKKLVQEDILSDLSLWPKAIDPKLDRARSQFTDFVRENLNFRARVSFEPAEYSEPDSILIEVPGVGCIIDPGEGFPLVHVCGGEVFYRIDPTENIMEQFEKIAEQHKAFERESQAPYHRRQTKAMVAEIKAEEKN